MRKTEKLGYINQKHSINHVFVGISPSFYPVEFLFDGLKYLFNRLIINGINEKICDKKLILIYKNISDIQYISM